jgi:hypothetical protein
MSRIVKAEVKGGRMVTPLIVYTEHPGWKPKDQSYLVGNSEI